VSSDGSELSISRFISEATAIMIVEILVWGYAITQALNFVMYYPVIKAIVDSPTADAINVPACFWYFSTGAVAAVYMVVLHDDWLACGIICGHIFIGNLSQGILALYKQRRHKSMILNSSHETRGSLKTSNNGKSGSSAEDRVSPV
tara:strand:+ start:307 stop:744 length:438 start_codon:yes stop_codon:yes gene_type:complete